MKMKTLLFNGFEIEFDPESYKKSEREMVKDILNYEFYEDNQFTVRFEEACEDYNVYVDEYYGTNFGVRTIREDETFSISGLKEDIFYDFVTKKVDNGEYQIID